MVPFSRFLVPLTHQPPNHLEPLKVTKATVLGQPLVVVAGPTDYLAPCPTRHSGLSFESYWIDPRVWRSPLQELFAANLPEGNDSCLHFVSITAGRFSTATHDQLLVAYGVEGGNVKVLPFDINAQGSAVQQQIYDTGVPVGHGFAAIRSGRFDWSSPVEQAALLISNDLGAADVNTVRILSFDQNFTPQAGPAFQANVPTDCASDMVVGNFDHTQPNPLTPSPATIANPNLQVAAVFSDCGNTVNVRILNVDPANQFQLSFASAWIQPLASAFQATLATVDLQGRSRRVGPPDIVTINNRQQATLTLAAPPMHVDAVVPVDGKVNDAPQPTNITGVPDGLYGGYTFSGTSDHNTNTTRGLTWSFGAQSLSEKSLCRIPVAEGPIDIGGFKALEHQVHRTYPYHRLA